jgi:hypothetical protein
MLALLAAVSIAAGCDLEKPSEAPGCRRAVIDRSVRLDQIQLLGTHNSYKAAIAPVEMATLRANNAKQADGLDYSHRPLSEQLDAGARVLELDVVLDPQGGRYADPLGLRLAGGKSLPYDATPMRRPGLKVLHVQDFDYRSVCALFVDCLREIRAWSKTHPDHAPIFISLNLKDDDLKTPGTVHALKFDAAAMDGVDAEIRQVFALAEMITPDSVQGRYPTLRAAARAHAWPTLGAARGKVLFALDEGPEKVALYRGARRSLEGRAMFVNTDEASPAAAYLTLNEAQKPSERARIRRDVAAGYLVRTRADADTVEARRNDTRRRTAAFASGAQFISTDYMEPDLRFGPYVVRMPGGLAARLMPVSTLSKVGKTAP